MVVADEETGGGWRTDCARWKLLRDGRQSGRQPGQPLLGICTEGKHYRASSHHLLVGARGRCACNVHAGRATPTSGVRDDPHVQQYTMGQDLATGTLNAPQTLRAES